jgi:hypothetical protein
MAARAAADHWLALPAEERSRTAIYVASRRLRSEVNAAVQEGRRANGELGAERLSLETLVRVNATREELRHANTFHPGQVIVFTAANRSQGIKPGEHRVERIDRRAGTVHLRDPRANTRIFRPGRLKPGQDAMPLELYDAQKLELHVGDPVRWTASNHRRGLFNADRAEVIALSPKGMTVRTSAGVEQTLKAGDPMLRRLDLAYALNAHMAQGLTSDRGIAVLDSSERKLASQQTFLVTITRLRDGLTLIVDSGERLGRAIERNPGTKTSALESVRQIDRAGKDKAPALQPEVSKPELSVPQPPSNEARKARSSKSKGDRELQRTRSRSRDYGL